MPPPASVASSPPSSRPQAVAPRPLWRLPPPASVASSPPSSRPQAVAPRPLWRLPPPASVASSPPTSRPQAVAPRPLWRLPPPASVASSPNSSRPPERLAPSGPLVLIPHFRPLSLPCSRPALGSCSRSYMPHPLALVVLIPHLRPKAPRFRPCHLSLDQDGNDSVG